MEVLLTSPWIPPEWVVAHGHCPRLFACAAVESGFTGATTAGVCSFAARAGRLAETRNNCAFVFCSTCDQMRRATDDLEASVRDRTFLLNFPATNSSETAYKMVREELRRLGSFLVRLGGSTPSMPALKSVMRQYENGRIELSAAATWLHGVHFPKAACGYFNNGMVNLPPETDVAPVRAATKRLAVVGGPLGPVDWALFSFVEALGARVVLNATDAGERGINPGPSHQCVDLVESLARATLDRCVDVFQRPNRRLYDWLGPRLEHRGVHGILLWSYIGCDFWRAEAASLREAFSLPVLSIEIEAGGGASPRNLGRIEAFIESIAVHTQASHVL